MASSRGALDLLNSYGDDSSDDDVPGPRVSTKRIFKDSEDEEEPKKSLRLPVPSIFTDKDQNTHQDDPELHNGRIRSFRHERGNWATYVYIPYMPEHNIEEISQELIKYLKHIELSPIDHYHISLTRTVVLRHHWISSFADSIKSKISFVRKFIIIFGSLKVYCNDERTRTFLGLEVKTGYDTLANIVQVLDSCLSEFNLPAFYKDPSFHMSILWCLGDKEAELKSMLPELNNLYLQSLSNLAEDHLLTCVDHLQCKTGNKLFTFQIL